MLTRRTILAALAASPLAPALGADWPAVVAKPEWVSELNERFAGRSGIFHDDSYKLFLRDYTPDGDYLGWSQRVFQNDAELAIMPDGLPKVRDEPNGPLYWNAVTLCHYALSKHGAGDYKSFLVAADKLRDIQSQDGGFPYPRRPYRDLVLADGWVSAMAQGQALSVFYRAHLVTKDEAYIEAGERAFSKLMQPIGQGGCKTSMKDFSPSLSGYLFFPEYPTKPVDYTLNGFMFCMLGLYDWSKINQASGEAFQETVHTLKRVLPYHDIDGFSTYDLSHYVFGLLPYVAPSYLGIHVYLLRALSSVAGGFGDYERRWAEKIDAMNIPLRITTIEYPATIEVGNSVAVTLDCRGGTGAPALYKFAIKSGNDWSLIRDYSAEKTCIWTPEKAGEYILGFYAKNTDSALGYDNFRYAPLSVRERASRF